MRQASREYQNKNANLETVARISELFFREEGFKTQSSHHPRGYFMQAQKGGVFRTILSTDKAFTITIYGESNDFHVRMGISKWLADLDNSSVDTFFVAPLAALHEVPEALWAFETEHHFWHYIETQINLGIQ